LATRHANDGGPRSRRDRAGDRAGDRGGEAPVPADGIWAIHFNTVLLAAFDERDYIITG